MIQLNCAIPEDLHTDVKIVAASQGVPLKALVVESLAEYVAEHPPVLAGNSIRRKTRRED